MNRTIIYVACVAACAAILYYGFKRSVEPAVDDKLTKVSAANFDEQVLQSDVPVLIEFTADW